MSNINKQISEAFQFRYACKAFDPDRKVSEEDFATILESAHLSPSSFGFEPWKFLVIQNPEIREKIKEATWGGQGQIPTASYFVVILARKASDTKYDSEYIQHVMRDVQKLPEDVQKMKGNFFKNFEQNEFDLTEDRALFDWAGKQCYIALANMMTAAAFLEIDSCPMEGFDQKKVDQILTDTGLMDPAHFGVSVMAAFGYRSDARNIHEKTRGNKEEIIQWVK